MQKLSDITVAVVGPGDFGFAIAHCFMKRGASVMLTGRDIRAVTNRATEFNLKADVQPMLNTVVNADLVLLTMPDSAIESVCRTLSINFKRGAVVAHFSSELDSTVLESAHRKDGVYICSLYAQNIFPDYQANVKLFTNRFHLTSLYSEGDKQALEFTNHIFEQVGFLPIEITRSAKPKYHAAAVIARDYLTILMESCMKIAESTGIDQNIYWRSLQPLVKGTLQSIGERGFDSTLSGPILRGDVETIERHLIELQSVSANLPVIYANLGKHVLSHAVKKDALSRETILKIHTLLDSVLKQAD